jgi:carbamoyltransferase
LQAILGISAFYHDSAAALIVDGRIVAAAQEERFTRKKHDSEFPRQSVEYCLGEAGIKASDLAYIAFYEKPLRKFERLLETYLAFAPRGFTSFRKALPVWLKEKLYHRRMLRAGVPDATNAKLVFTDHHESHAASAFFPSPFERAAILTIDGVGEWSTTTVGVGEGHQIQMLQQIRFPHSLGLLYSAFTYYCGFKVNSGEYKLMGLAPYGKPIYRDQILEKLITLRDDGSFRLNLDYFDYCHGLQMTSRRFHDLFGGPPRQPESPMQQRHFDLAASIQSVTEDCVLKLGRHVHQQTGSPNLCLAGGVALNCVANGRLLREGPFERIWIQPAAGDAGGALGAALFTWHQLLDQKRTVDSHDSQSGSLLGPEFSSDQIQRTLDGAGAVYERIDDATVRQQTVARALAEGNVVGWFNGRMEFGPRALGARSILADPRHPKMQSTLNLKIKFRESFRPFAPAVLREHSAEWFGLKPEDDSPYMLLVAPVLESHRVTPSAEELRLMDTDPDLCARVNVVRSSIPAVTHVDYSARIQTVDEVRNPGFYGLLKAFYELTNCPVIANTSFNVRGEPIVCTPLDAWRCFQATEMDLLVIGSFVMYKSRQTAKADLGNREAHLARFELD